MIFPATGGFAMDSLFPIPPDNAMALNAEIGDAVEFDRFAGEKREALPVCRFVAIAAPRKFGRMLKADSCVGSFSLNRFGCERIVRMAVAAREKLEFAGSRFKNDIVSGCLFIRPGQTTADQNE